MIGGDVITKGQLEAKISEIVSKFELEYMGRGPKSIRSFIVGDMIIIRLAGFLSPSEKELTDSPQGIELFKKMRTALFEGGRGYLEAMITEVVDAAIVSTHSDISTKTGEKLIVIVVSKNLEELFTAK